MVLPPEVVELIDSLRREIEALRAENAELRRRLGLDSSNSSKPPSSDGLKKKPRVLKSLRTRTGKPSGGQKGHDGDTLRQVAEPDAVVEHAAEVCEHCLAHLPADSKVGEEKRQVFDLPETPLIVTEHRAAVHDCPACRRRTRAAFPEGVVSPAQYGERVRAAAVYLNAQQLVPEERTAQVLQDLFGAAAACGASVAAWVRRKAEALAPVHRAIGACVAAAPQSPDPRSRTTGRRPEALNRDFPSIQAGRGAAWQLRPRHRGRRIGYATLIAAHGIILRHPRIKSGGQDEIGGMRGSRAPGLAVTSFNPFSRGHLVIPRRRRPAPRATQANAAPRRLRRKRQSLKPTMIFENQK